MYHYTDCGLRNVWLKNGYKNWETPYGKGTSISDLDGLHKAIGLHIVRYKHRLSGAEIRFLRGELDLSQRDLASILGVSENSVRAWENSRSRITRPAERLLRALYKEHVSGDGTVRDLIERISQINRDIHLDKLELENTNGQWREAA